MIHTTELTTRSYECDSYGHVNNAIYLNYLEYARIQFLNDLPVPYHELRLMGVGFVVARLCIDYKLQVGSGELLRIETRSIKKQKVRMVFRQSVYRKDELVAQAEVTWACIDDQGRANILTVGWFMQTSIDPPLMAISIGKTRWSHEAILGTGEFVLSFPSSKSARPHARCLS